MSTLDDHPLFETSSENPYPRSSPIVGSLLDTSHFPQNNSNIKLFQTVKIRGLETTNAIFVSPMCQYSAASQGEDANCANDWHRPHYTQFAIRGPGLITTEATAVTKEGRLSPQELGLYTDQQAAALKPIVDQVHAAGSKFCVQLAHAGRKASTLPPWLACKPDESKVATKAEYGGFEDEVIAPSAIPYHAATYPHPREMTEEDIEHVKRGFVEAAKRADKIGVDALNIHAAHGYLMHSFLSPLSNHRTDKYGGSLEKRLRLNLELIAAVREIWPAEKPLFLRISATEWHPAGEKDEKGEWISWGIEQSKIFVREAVKLGVDLIDVSSGGNAPDQAIESFPLYQVPLAASIHKSVHDDAEKNGNVPPLVSAVGLITTAKQAEGILQQGKADVVSVAREALRNPSFVFDWAQDLGVAVSVPKQYGRAFTRMLKKRIPRDDHQCHCDGHGGFPGQGEEEDEANGKDGRNGK